MTNIAQHQEAQHFANLAAMFLEEALKDPDGLINEEVLIDPDVSEEGRPFVVMTVETFNYEARAERFEKPLEVTHKGVTHTVDVVVRPDVPAGSLN